MVPISLLLTLLLFCSDLGISLSFSSSYHHQSVPSECSVRTVKNTMKKCHETGTPWHLGLLEYLCTPLDEKTPPPSSLLSRQFKKDFAQFLTILTVVKVYWGILSIVGWMRNYTMTEGVIPCKIFLQAVQLLCLIIVQALGLLGMY